MTLLKALVPSLFHRRLILLMSLATLGALLLTAQIGRLAIVRAESLQRVAESKLVRRQLTATVRGRILDRKGRILAQDRPSYNVAIAYPVLSGKWPQEQARRFVRRAYREQWAEFTAAQRTALVDRAAAAYQRHLDAAWHDFAVTAGQSDAELLAARRAAISEVERMSSWVSERRRAKALAEVANRDTPLTQEEERSIEARVSAPIREEGLPRVLLSRVDDRTAFAFQQLENDEVEITPLGSDPGTRSADRVARIPGLKVIDTGDRDYPLDDAVVDVDASTLPGPMRTSGTKQVATSGITTQIVGWMREVWAEDANDRAAFLAQNPAASAEAVIDLADAGPMDRGGYQDGDRVGQTGVEGGFESVLRGIRGVRTRQLDTGLTQEIPALAGRDVRLTIDVMLQARVQAAMSPSLGLARVQAWHRSSTEPANPTMPDGTAINGAAVVLDIDTGDILAMVSTPVISRQALRDDPESIFGDAVNLPYMNRAIGRPYPPGSIVKPLMLNGAIVRGAYSPDQHISCTGHLLANEPDKYRCWIYKRYQTTHTEQLGHELDGADAIMVSCNIFFFTLGRRLGPEGIVDLYHDFGVGTAWNLGIGPEYPGSAGHTGVAKDLTIGDAIQMGIGQGPIAWTPLHAANAYATLARGGVRITPHVVTTGRAASTSEIRLDPAGVAMAMEGLLRSANDDLGTGHLLTYHGGKEPIFNAPGVTVWGKTGTASAPDLKIRRGPDRARREESSRPDAAELEHDGETARGGTLAADVVRSGDHSWFVVLVGRDGQRPKYAIAVLMEYAGSGGRVSGPICNQIIHALMAEGYL